jgi:hypothetical protein
VTYSSGPVDADKTFDKISQFVPFLKPSKDKDSGKKEEMDFEAKKMQLRHRVDAVTSGLRPTGVRCVRLGTEELLEVYYNLYNPEKTEKKGLKIMSETSE